MAESSSPSNTSPSTPAPIAEIDHGPGKLDQFLENHQKKLIIGAILVALGVVAYIIYDGLAEAKAQEAGHDLLKAEKTADYQGVIKKHPDSNAAASALPLLANLQWEDSRADAITSLEQFINNHPEHPSTATAKVSLGLRQLEQGKTTEAVTTLTEVTTDDNASYIAPLACIALGDIAKAATEIDQARTWYEKAQGETPGLGNTFKDTAAARLKLVNAKPPVKIKPAPPEPPTPPTPPTPVVPTPLVPAAKPPATPPVAPPLPETPDTPKPTEKKPETNDKKTEPTPQPTETPAG